MTMFQPLIQLAPAPALPRPDEDRSQLPERLVDEYGRVVKNLRLSITDRCNFRCVYCMPEEMQFFPRAEILSYEELVRLAGIGTRMGIDKIRLTGGEPLVRRDVPVLVRALRALPGLRDLSLTTNGVRLAELAAELYDAGLRRINVSLDSLDRGKFERITRRDFLEQVLAGLDEAERVGFSPIKVNAVAMRDFTEEELLGFARLARERPFQVRFIEFMPLDADNIWERSRILTGREIIERISAVCPLERVSTGPSSDPATGYRFVDGVGEIGIIASVTEPFCGACDRIRLTADGKLRTCLFAVEEFDLKTPLRAGAGDVELGWRIADAVSRKGPGHMINSAQFVKPARTMSQIGG
jgi:cyclic pyranopterin phosphate synthase